MKPISYTDKLLRDLETWNPSIANKPLKPIRKTTAQLVGEPRDPCTSSINCGNCDDLELQDCNADRYASEEEITMCENENLLLQMKCYGARMACVLNHTMESVGCYLDEATSGP